MDESKLRRLLQQRADNGPGPAGLRSSTITKGRRKRLVAASLASLAMLVVLGAMALVAVNLSQGPTAKTIAGPSEPPNPYSFTGVAQALGQRGLDIEATDSAGWTFTSDDLLKKLGRLDPHVRVVDIYAAVVTSHQGTIQHFNQRAVFIVETTGFAGGNCLSFYDGNSGKHEGAACFYPERESSSMPIVARWYTSAMDVARGLQSNGGDCANAGEPGSYISTHGEQLVVCDVDAAYINIRTYRSPVTVAASGGKAYTVVGPNWLVTTASPTGAETVQRTLGGRLLLPEQPVAPSPSPSETCAEAMDCAVQPPAKMCEKASTRGDFDGDGKTDTAYLRAAVPNNDRCNGIPQSWQIDIKFNNGSRLEHDLSQCRDAACGTIFESVDLAAGGPNQLAVDVGPGAAIDYVEFFEIQGVAQRHLPERIVPLQVASPGAPKYGVTPGPAIFGGGFNGQLLSPITCNMGSNGKRWLVVAHAEALGSSPRSRLKVRRARLRLKGDVFHVYRTTTTIVRHFAYEGPFVDKCG